MKTSFRLALCLLFAAFVSARASAQDKVLTEITILVPDKGQEETVVKVNGKKLDGEGPKRIYRAALDKGKIFKFKIEALIEPNNYTKITRRKEIAIKGGENDNVKIDMTADQSFEEVSKADDIVVRFVPTPDDIVDEMSKLAKITKDDVVYDLGCGDAVMLVRPIMKFGAKKGVGVEYDPEVLKKAIENVKKNKLEDKIVLRQGDMLKLQPKDVEDATVVLLYIGDDLGRRVSPVLKNTLKPGSRIVSHRFLLGDWKADKSITVKGQDGGEYELHLWIVPDRKLDKGDK
ncbi:MAG: class I SAM-dependent methyltransferase [Planctomycetes bacterium]|nr:class I SAM-dependent methyltransferase [Planctomycetota bacterium]